MHDGLSPEVYCGPCGVGHARCSEDSPGRHPSTEYHVCLCSVYRSSWSSCRSRKTTSKMNRRTWRRNICTLRRKWNAFRACRLWLVSSLKPSTRTTALWDRPQVQAAQTSELYLCRLTVLVWLGGWVQTGTTALWDLPQVQASHNTTDICRLTVLHSGVSLRIIGWLTDLLLVLLFIIIITKECLNV